MVPHISVAFLPYITLSVQVVQIFLGNFFFENLNDSDFSELESLLGLINRFVFYLGKRISSLDPFRVFSCKFFIKDLIHSLKELISISPFGCLKLPPRSRP